MRARSPSSARYEGNKANVCDVSDAQPCRLWDGSVTSTTASDSISVKSPIKVGSAVKAVKHLGARGPGFISLKKGASFTVYHRNDDGTLYGRDENGNHGNIESDHLAVLHEPSSEAQSAGDSDTDGEDGIDLDLRRHISNDEPPVGKSGITAETNPMAFVTPKPGADSHDPFDADAFREMLATLTANYKALSEDTEKWKFEIIRRQVGAAAPKQDNGKWHFSEELSDRRSVEHRICDLMTSLSNMRMSIAMTSHDSRDILYNVERLQLKAFDLVNAARIEAENAAIKTYPWSRDKKVGLIIKPFVNQEEWKQCEKHSTSYSEFEKQGNVFVDGQYLWVHLKKNRPERKREIYVRVRVCSFGGMILRGFSKKWYVDLHTGLIFDFNGRPLDDSSDKFAKDATTTANATDQKSSKDEGARGKSFSPYRLLRSATDRVLGSPQRQNSRKSETIQDSYEDKEEEWENRCREAEGAAQALKEENARLRKALAQNRGQKTAALWNELDGMRTCMQESTGTVDGLVNSMDALRVEMEHIKFDLLGGYLACKEELKQEKHKNKKHVEMAKSFRERLVKLRPLFSSDSKVNASIASEFKQQKSVKIRSGAAVEEQSRSLPKNLLSDISAKRIEG